MKQWYMVIDIAKCHDCNNCFMGCQDEHVGNDWDGYTSAQPQHGHRWINIHRKERGGYSRNDVAFLPMPCMHCGDAPCVKAGNGAVKQREDGIVMIDMYKAKGNKALVDGCPYKAIYWNEELEIAQKCTFCAHLLDDGWEMPRCVHNCPTGAMKMYNILPSEMEGFIKTENLEVYKAELNTKPHVFYKTLQRFTKMFIAGGVITSNEYVRDEKGGAYISTGTGGSVFRKDDCVEGAKVTLKEKASGRTWTQTTNFFGDFKFDGLDSGNYELLVEGVSSKTAVDALLKDQALNLGFIKI